MRDCKCSGKCGPATDGITRRQFVALVGAGVAGALVMHNGVAWADSSPSASQDIERWKQSLRQQSSTRIYQSAIHTDARMPLGGIGTGNIDIGPDGQLTGWQLFNTESDGYVPFCFLIRAGDTVRLLQTSGGPNLPRVGSIEMTGQYPIADLKYIDNALPIDVSMSAFSPFRPLDSAFSSLPLIAFVFSLKNNSVLSQSVSLSALMQNPVGYDAVGPSLTFDRTTYPNFGGNYNSVKTSDKCTTVLMGAQPGSLPSLVRPLNIYTNIDQRELNAVEIDRSPLLSIRDVASLPGGYSPQSGEDTVLWLEDAPVDFPEAVLSAARDAVKSGSTLIFAGKRLSLVNAYTLSLARSEGHAVAARADEVFDDFENGYDKWTIEGNAFGAIPEQGTLPGQQQVSGFIGHGLVNSFVGGDGPVGKMTSVPFSISRDYITFLIGGGAGSGTQIRLVVNGQIVFSQSGENSELLLPAVWDVRDFAGQTAHFEIVDSESGSWGHILVDDIRFVDTLMTASQLALLRDLLGDTPRDLPQDYRVSAGTGKIVVHQGQLLDPNLAMATNARQVAYSDVAKLAGINYARPTGTASTLPGFGTMALTTLGPSPTVLVAFDDYSAAAGRFTTDGKFDEVVDQAASSPTENGNSVNAAVASTVEIAPGESVDIPFLLSWHYPNNYYGNTSVGNLYTQKWSDASAVATFAAGEFAELKEKTDLFRQTFYDSTLPSWMLDCVTSQISTIRHRGVIFQIANGDIYGWEGANGCCGPTCTHVYGYEQTLAHVFPGLERKMRDIDFDHQQRPDGGVNNRTDVPSPMQPSGQNPFTDGHCSTILKAYREVLNASDSSVLAHYWPHTKRAVDYLIARDAASSGGVPNGTISDAQDNTYDDTVFGVNSFIGSYYLAALRAGEEMAKLAGDINTAKNYHALFEIGTINLDSQCWNGEYYVQNLPNYEKMSGQYGPGCLSDQLIGQWWAHTLGLGYILPEDHVKTAMRSLYNHNFLTDFTNFQNNMRQFAGGNDKGLLVCTWPKGGRPNGPIPYCDEVWTGIEYQVASHMLFEGMIDEALAIVKGARDRYDGVPRPPMGRSPWCDNECGGHYARAMSSWSLLLAVSGFHYSAPSKELTFKPINLASNNAPFKSFFSSPEGWGTLIRTPLSTGFQHEVIVADGTLSISKIKILATEGVSKVVARMGNHKIPSTYNAGEITFAVLVEVTPSQPLSIVTA